MKKIFLPVLALLCVFIYSCKKKDSTTAPSACLKVNVVDSAGLYYHNVVAFQTYLATIADPVQRENDSLDLYDRIDETGAHILDSTLAVNDYSYLRPLSDNEEVYNQAIYFEYCGTGSNNKSIYTGETNHVLADSVGAAEGGTGVNFPATLLKYNYTAAGYYKAAVVATNISEYGGEVKQGIARKSFFLK